MEQKQIGRQTDSLTAIFVAISCVLGGGGVGGGGWHRAKKALCVTVAGGGEGMIGVNRGILAACSVGVQSSSLLKKCFS